MRLTLLKAPKCVKDVTVETVMQRFAEARQELGISVIQHINELPGHLACAAQS